MKSHLKQTDADLAVLNKVRRITSREVLDLAIEYARAHLKGVRVSERQEELKDKIKRRGYHITYITPIAMLVRTKGMNRAVTRCAVRDYVDHLFSK